MHVKALVVDKKDNVATALQRLEKGDVIEIEIGVDFADILLSQTIPFGHKLALIDIDRGEPIVKYGEIIGLSTEKIGKGDLVHIHNVEGLRGRGDKQ